MIWRDGHAVCCPEPKEDQNRAKVKFLMRLTPLVSLELFIQREPLDMPQRPELPGIHTES